MNPSTIEQNMQSNGSLPSHSHKLLVTILILCVLLAAAMVFYSKSNKTPTEVSKCDPNTKCVELDSNTDSAVTPGQPLTKVDQSVIDKAFTANTKPLPKTEQESITKAYLGKNTLTQSDIDKITKANTGK